MRTGHFSEGSRPVIRWVKGDGLDDAVTRSAIAQATRLFGRSVDYCLCTSGVSASRTREVLAWADQPVEWWPLEPADNAELAEVLLAAGCDPDHFGFWWKWFPERVRPAAPEWVLDGDMVIVGPPSWFSAWKSGQDPLRMTKDDRNTQYGEYVAHVDLTTRLYSGLVSLPPNLRYMDECLAILRGQPLLSPHDGRKNVSEQGVVAAAFGRLGAIPIPLSEFPFANALQGSISYGPRRRKKIQLPSALEKIPFARALNQLLKFGEKTRLRIARTFDRRERPWGYHFARAFVTHNQHFERLVAQGTIHWQKDYSSPRKRFAWMRNNAQWGREGWSMHPTCVARVATLACTYDGKPVLEIGTSRGYVAAVMAACGCRVTTVDRVDRGARKNLDGLGVNAVVSDASAFLSASQNNYSLIVVDLHGNDAATWQELWPKLRLQLDRSGKMVLYNSHLWKIPEWHDQTGVAWVMQNASDGMVQQVFEDPLPGMIICAYE